LLGGLCLAVAWGCQPKNVYEPPPPPTVTIAQPVQKSVTNYLEETGTTEAVERVEVRARVKGFLTQVNFEPGADVKKGDILYIIQPREFKAQVDAAQAALDAAQVALDKAKIEYARQQKLLAGNATSETQVVAAKAEEDGAAAEVAAAKAVLDQKQLDFEYTEVRAPIDGRVGKTLVKAGNLVGDSEATHLTTVIKYDPIYANFNISERALLNIIQQTPHNEQNRVALGDVKLFLRRANDTDFLFEGRGDYAALDVDQSTGTFLIRGIFPNPERKIVPGLFVRIRLPLDVQKDALLVPERAVGADQRGKYVLVVNRENEVERQPVTVGTKTDDMVVIREGLEAGAQVIIEGLQRARPGAKVTPRTAEQN
jgi:RND family efflux transporter MFP subunit